MVVERNIKRFLEGTDENRNPHNAPFRFIVYPDEPIFEDEDLLDVGIVLGRIANRILERHESEPEPENEPMPEPEYDEPIPENYHDLMEKLEQGIDFLVGDLLYEFRLSDDELRSMLTHILNDPNPANHSDELRALLEGGDVLNDVVECIEYHHLDINEVVDYALYNLNLRRRRPRLYYE